MKYTILQLDSYNIDVMKDEKLFVSWDDLNKYSKFDISQYYNCSINLQKTFNNM